MMRPSSASAPAFHAVPEYRSAMLPSASHGASSKLSWTTDRCAAHWENTRALTAKRPTLDSACSHHRRFRRWGAWGGCRTGRVGHVHRSWRQCRPREHQWGSVLNAPCGDKADDDEVGARRKDVGKAKGGNWGLKVEKSDRSCPAEFSVVSRGHLDRRDTGVSSWNDASHPSHATGVDPREAHLLSSL